MRLFARILELLFPLRESAKQVKDTSMRELCARCAPTRFSLAGIETTGLLPYRDQDIRAFILEAKFHGNQRAQEVLGQVLADHLLERVSDETAFGSKIVLVPLPLGNMRRRERGYNQTEAICRMAAAHLGDSVLLKPEILYRSRETLPQTTLSGNARRRNMEGAFGVAVDLNPSYTYIVVDDVVTTGATLLAATTALREAGVHKVSAIALAH